MSRNEIYWKIKTKRTCTVFKENEIRIENREYLGRNLIFKKI